MFCSQNTQLEKLRAKAGIAEMYMLVIIDTQKPKIYI